MKSRENLLVILLFALCMLLASQIKAQNPKKGHGKKGSHSQMKRTRTKTGPKTPAGLSDTPAKKPINAPVSVSVSASASAPEATTSAFKSSIPPSHAIGYTGNPSPLVYLMRLTSDTASNQPPHGSVGVSATLFFKGHLLAGVVVKKSIFYYSVGAGVYANKTILTATNDLIVYGGAGIKAKSRVSVGLITTLTLLSNPHYQYVGNQPERINTKSPSIGIGLQGNFELRKHLWVSATLHTTLGTGLGATYFF